MSDQSLKTLLIFVGGALWLVGGNLVLARYYRKQGTSLWAEWKPFTFPWAAVAATWPQLLILVLASMACLVTALQMNGS